MWRGGLGAAYLFPPLSSGGASIASPCSVSTSRSSNRTYGFPASGSPTAVAFRRTPPTLSRRLHLKAKLVPGSPGLSLEGIGLRHSPDLCSLPKRVRSQAPFLRRHYPASRVLRACPPPHTARPGPRGLPVGEPPPPLGFPVLRRISLYTCRRHYPGGIVGCSRCSLPQRQRPSPKSRRGRLTALPFSRPAQRSRTLRPAYSPSRLATLYTRGFEDFVTYVPTPVASDWSNSCRVGLAPTEDPRLFTAHWIHYGLICCPVLLVPGFPENLLPDSAGYPFSLGAG